ncbi:MAG: hypothetical protein KDM81_11190, partial [Verrucomicrobiae bacterium]|nr:hypothetical protein [Verrucomicrobiae bacterium]
MPSRFCHRHAGGTTADSEEPGRIARNGALVGHIRLPPALRSLQTETVMSRPKKTWREKLA